MSVTDRLRKLIHHTAPAIGAGEIFATKAWPLNFYKNAPRRTRHYKTLLAVLCHMVGRSPQGHLHLQTLMRQGWRAGFADLRTDGFHLDTHNRVIWLDCGSYSSAQIAGTPHMVHKMTLIFAGAIREAWQDSRFGLNYIGTYRPDALLLIERCRAADAAAFTVQVAWDLRHEHGQHGLWHALLTSTDHDIALAYSAVRERHGPADPKAQIAALERAFHTWFACKKRIYVTDRFTLDLLDDELALADHPFGSRKLDAAFLFDLSRLPNGQAYLTSESASPASDPYFARFEDLFHQAHLLQIIRESRAVWRHGVPFRTGELAARMFPAPTLQDA